MQYGCTLEMINLRTSGPNQLYMQSRSYWIEIFKFLAAAGFTAIEMPYNPYSGDPVTLEIGRCGVPISRFAVESQYGSAKEFRAMLKDFGIYEITGIHINVNDTMLDLIGRFREKGLLFEEFTKLAREAIDFAVEIGAPELIVSPTPELGFVEKYLGADREYEQKTIQTIQKIADMAKEKALKVVIRNEFWSLYRGEKVVSLLNALEGEHIYYSPDLANLTIAKADPIKLIKQLKGRIASPRFNDTSFEDSMNNYKKANAEIPSEGAQRLFYDMGDGNIDIPAIAKTLKESGYDGNVICECKKTLNVYKALLKMRWYADHVLGGKEAAK